MTPNPSHPQLVSLIQYNKISHMFKPQKMESELCDN